MKRRSFLKASALASTSLMIPAFLKGYTTSDDLLNSRSGKNLVIIQLSGGNDGLNTIIPYQDDIYYRNRPSLGIGKDKVLQLTDKLGFNPGMEALRSVFNNGEMSIINSVGYPNPNRSHFRSMDIWHTASSSNEYLQTGWLGRFLDSNCTGCEKPYHAIEMDESLSLAMKGVENSGFAMTKPSILKRTANNPFLKIAAEQYQNHEESVDYLYKTMIDTQSSADYLYEQSKVHRSSISYPNSSFAKDLRQVAELITADTDTKIYYLSLSGFDTHAFQQKKQEKLLKTYAEAISAFLKDLKHNNLFDDTLVMTFSEFGRRVKQNASNGTDHGTANNLFLMGGQLSRPGFYNSAPDLSKLDNGDLIYEIDFRNIYASILEDWLGTNSTTILNGSFDKLKILG